MTNIDIDSIVDAVVKELQSKTSTPDYQRREPARKNEGEFNPGRKSKTNLKVTVCGAGHGGLAMAGHIALIGAQVTLFSAFERELEPVIKNGGIEIVGDEVAGFAKLHKVTSAIDEAIRGANLIMICSPALGHSTYPALMTPYLEDDQVIVLNPGRTGGALEFAMGLQRLAISKRIYLGEAQTFIYAAEMRGPGKVEILKEKFKMRVAALPATDNDRVISTLNEIYPQIVAARNVLETSLNNVGPVVHPAPMLLNTSVIERVAQGEDLRYYKQQVTKTISDLVMESIDEEKYRIAQELKLEILRTVDFYRESYHAKGDSIYEVLQNNHYYEGFHAAGHLMGYNHVLDEVPNSLVPLSLIARQLNLKTPAIDAIVDLAKVMTKIDFWKVGRTLEKMGLDGLSGDEMIDLVENKPLFDDCRSMGACRLLPQFL